MKGQDSSGIKPVVADRAGMLCSKHSRIILYTAITIMALYTLLSFSNQFWRLLFDESRLGAIDLRSLHYMVSSFFSGNPFRTPYPPGSFPVIWPLVGWMPVTAARWLWAFLYIGALLWLSQQIIRASLADGLAEKWFVVLLLLSINGTGQTIGTGQLGLFILPALITGLYIIHKNHEGLFSRDMIGALLLTAALVKPTISVPFIWLALFVGRIQPVLLVILFYLLLTVFAATFREPALLEQIHNWLSAGSRLGAAAGKGSSSIYNLLSYIDTDIPYLNIKVSVFILASLGIWIYFHRNVDLWILLGVTGIIARLWTYHRIYDDVLIIFPMVALFRLVKAGYLTTRECLLGGILLGSSILVNFIPSRIQHRFPSPWPELYSIAHITVWLAMLVFLGYLAWRQARR
jgi:hypothetical protein